MKEYLKGSCIDSDQFEIYKIIKTEIIIIKEYYCYFCMFLISMIIISLCLQSI